MTEVDEVLFSKEDWLIVNDDVMGGLSSSQACEKNTVLTFSGYLSVENNGGFTSARKHLEKSLAGTIGFRLTLQGDGRSYQLRIRTDDRADGVAWRHTFKTDGRLQEVIILVNDFEPVYRGRLVPGVAPLNPSSIKQLGFMLVDKIEGPFELVIHSIDQLPASGDSSLTRSNNNSRKHL